MPKSSKTKKDRRNSKNDTTQIFTQVAKALDEFDKKILEIDMKRKECYKKCRSDNPKPKSKKQLKNVEEFKRKMPLLKNMYSKDKEGLKWQAFVKQYFSSV